MGLENARELHDCHLPDSCMATFGDGNCPEFHARHPDEHAPWHEYRRKPKDPAAVKRGKASKRKGKKGEDEIGKHVVKRIGGEAWIRRHDRDVQFHDNALAGHHIEVKRYAKFGMEKHCIQAEGDAATHGLSRWIVAWRPDGQTRWRISTDLDDYLQDMAELAERRAREDVEE